MIRTIRRLCATLAACAATLLLGSCGGVGQDGTGAAPDTRTTGVITGFGSVVVNGIHFDVSTAGITVDGVGGRTQADLRVGMVVEVTGSVATDGASGTASSLVYESLLRGNVDDAPAGRVLRVLGQQVQWDDTTVFEGSTDATDLRSGDRLQISGFRNPDGSLRATWVSREGTSGDLQLTGFIDNLAGNTIRLAALDVDITNAALQGVTRAELAVGQLVRATLQAPPVAGAAVASRLRLIDTRLPDALRNLRLQGIVAQWDATTGRFSLNGQAVRIDAGTLFQDGSLADLANGTRVEVNGTLDSTKVLDAERVRIQGGPITGYGRGRVTAVDVAARSFRLLDTPGVEVRVDSRTLLNDTSLAGAVLRLDTLAVGDEVLVLGRADGSRIDASLVQRLPRTVPGAGVAGPVTAVSAGSLTILGISVGTGSASFFDAQGVAQTSAAFFATLQTGDEVRAEGVYLAGTLAALTVRRVR